MFLAAGPTVGANCRGIVTTDVSGWKLEYGDIATSDIGSLSIVAWGNKDLPRFGPSRRGKDLLLLCFIDTGFRGLGALTSGSLLQSLELGIAGPFDLSL